MQTESSMIFILFRERKMTLYTLHKRAKRRNSRTKRDFLGSFVRANWLKCQVCAEKGADLRLL